MLDNIPISKAEACRILATEGWLATAAADFRSEFLAKGQIRTFTSGSQISTAGDDDSIGSGMYGIVAGQVAVVPGMGPADTPVALLFHKGDWGGYAPLFLPANVAHIHAVIPTTILCLSIGEVRSMLHERPEWWKEIAKLSFEAGIRYAGVGVDQLIPNSGRRLAALLLHLANCRHSGAAKPIHLSQEEIGQTAKLSRHPTRHLLRDFDARGWISQSYRCIDIIQPEHLRACANSD
ncbi:hypothetical protein AQZ52_08585 [Novosphingobium fuchskuhlense]|uniref:HTH crp-type domain-containing protein n=1 Tax=Novosphingobium fuchskuhlense TaxID=1117702 RepID=A0A124JUX4_9SPHN|nr:helix-turn-helix domain-containing protein [Novosphingobium fuchskuhlense]KUR71660.1 hypothetical protein AQZ52_08585 [Novosphingobium fuchskuhlense]